MKYLKELTTLFCVIGLCNCIKLFAQTTSGDQQFIQRVFIDKLQDAGPLKVMPSIDKPNEYYYLPSNMELSVDKTGKPEFSFIQYVKNDNASLTTETNTEATVAGGFVHMILKLGVSKEDIEAAKSEITRTNALAVIKGPITYLNGTMELICGLINEDNKKKILGVAPAPTIEGDKIAVAFELDKIGASILRQNLESKSMPQISVNLNMMIRGYLSPVTYDLYVNFDEVYKHKVFQMGLASSVLSAEVQDMTQELISKKAIRIENVGANVEMEKRQELILNKILETCFEPLGAKGGLDFNQLLTSGNPNQKSALDRAQDRFDNESENYEKSAQQYAEALSRELNSPPSLSAIQIQTAEQKEAFIEQKTNDFISQNRNLGNNWSQLPIYKIPLIVHVLFKNVNDSITRNRIEEQIRILNKDFRKQNPDKQNIPVRFRNKASDTRIEFELRNIVYKRTNVNGFIMSDDNPPPERNSSTGGADPIDPDNTLNIWVCRISANLSCSSNANGCVLAGYTYRPMYDNVIRNGITINTAYFGSGNTGAETSSKGRTLTHEVGHWLNLLHIFGENNSITCGNDRVNDTPAQFGNGLNPKGSNLQAESIDTIPLRPGLCSNDILNNTHGEMFMNYMDYSPERDRVMFTYGQALRMRALFEPNMPRRAFLMTNTTTTSALIVDDNSTSDNTDSNPNDANVGNNNTADNQQNTTATNNNNVESPKAHLVAMYQSKTIKNKGEINVAQKSTLPATKTQTTSANIGRLNCPTCIQIINVNDPLYKQKEIQATTSGVTADDFKTYINNIQVSIRRPAGTNGKIVDSKIINRINYTSDANLFKLKYGWDNETRGKDWDTYDYKTTWVLANGATFDEDWTKTQKSNIELIPPVDKSYITISAENEDWVKQGIISATVVVKYTLKGKEFSTNATLSKAKNIYITTLPVYFENNMPLTYSYKVTWSKKGNIQIDSGWKSNNIETIEVSETF